MADQNAEDPSVRRVIVLEAEPGEIEAKRALFTSDVMIEPEILFYPTADWLSHTAPSDFVGADTIGSPSRSGGRLHIDVRASGYGSLSDARVTLYARGPSNATRAWSGNTDSAGSIEFTVDPGFLAAAAVIIPAHSFWPMIIRAPITGITVECPGLPGDGPFAWWHGALGIRAQGRPYGTGLKVGVIDTGCGPNPNLAHVNRVGAFIGGQRLPPSDAEDVDGHGTHTAGIIGARPNNVGEYAGVAESVELFAARVFDPGRAQTKRISQMR